MLLYEEPNMEIMNLQEIGCTNDLIGASGGDNSKDENINDWLE